MGERPPFVNEIVERSKDDYKSKMIVGSEIRQAIVEMEKSHEQQLAEKDREIVKLQGSLESHKNAMNSVEQYLKERKLWDAAQQEVALLRDAVEWIEVYNREKNLTTVNDLIARIKKEIGAE